METVTVVLSVGVDHAEVFEAGFRQHELPIWRDLQDRGLLVGATLSKLDISTSPVEGATQYMVVAIFATGEGHHAHDSHPAFKAWNEIADAYQVGGALAYGGETIVQRGNLGAPPT
jgi:hypothetical protein